MKIDLTKADYQELGRRFLELVLAIPAQFSDPEFGSKIFKKQNQCTRGYACGLTCIAKTLACKSPLQGQAKTYAGWLKLQIQAGAKLSDSQKTDARGLGLLKRKVAEAQSWYKAAFTKAPPEIQALLARVNDPYAEKTPIKKNAAAAHYSSANQAINMGKFDPKTPLGQLVYRHEFGHHADAELGRFRRTAMINQAIKNKAGVNSIEELEALKPKDPFNYAIAVQAAALAVGLPSYSDIGALKKVQKGDPPSYISSSKVATDSYTKDEEKLLTWNKGTRQAYVDVAVKDLAKYQASDPKLDNMLKAKGNDFSKLSRADQEAVGRQVMVAKVKNVLQERAKKLGLDPNDDNAYIEMAKKEFAQDNTIFGAMYRESVARGFMNEYPRQETIMLFLARGTRDPEIIARQVDMIRGGSNVQDLVGSLTKNKVSHGHADTYYSGKNGGIKQRTEILANTFDLHASGNELDRLTAQMFSPEGYKFFKGVVNAANTGKI